VEADGLIWKEVWGHPEGHTADDDGWEHFGTAATWGDCGYTREERIQCCEYMWVQPRHCCAAHSHEWVWLCFQALTSASASVPRLASPSQSTPPLATPRPPCATTSLVRFYKTASSQPILTSTAVVF
jgi:hypothetical protein